MEEGRGASWDKGTSYLTVLNCCVCVCNDFHILSVHSKSLRTCTQRFLRWRRWLFYFQTPEKVAYVYATNFNIMLVVSTTSTLQLLALSCVMLPLNQGLPFSSFTPSQFYQFFSQLSQFPGCTARMPPHKVSSNRHPKYPCLHNLTHQSKVQ